MARRILSAGLPLTVHDVEPTPVRRMVREGARRAGSVREVGGTSEESTPTVAGGQQ
jgi:3-hydroxyisobutyrate dehydrogenase-like beta-hydroxyacid dehydrogenase